MSGQLSRRDLLRNMLAPASVAIAGCGRTSHQRPNILFAIADDQSWPHAGAYGDRVARTPAFDRVSGKWKRRAFCTARSTRNIRSSRTCSKTPDTTQASRARDGGTASASARSAASGWPRRGPHSTASSGTTTPGSACGRSTDRRPPRPGPLPRSTRASAFL